MYSVLAWMKKESEYRSTQQWYSSNTNILCFPVTPFQQPTQKDDDLSRTGLQRRYRTTAVAGQQHVQQ